MTLRAGKLQARLTVTQQQLVDRPDGGQEVQDVVVVDAAAAQIEPIAADEELRQGVPFATVTHRARLRTQIDVDGQLIPITPAMTATARHGYTGQVQNFEINDVVDVEGRGRELELILTERVS